jgi:anti-sigma regulatory factor (Ser/Thr protein kinase)
MAKARKTAEVLPSARRLVNSLRDLGYQVAEAVADLVDNSIAAGAHSIEISIHFDGQDSWIRIADDGRGMGAGEITEAMRYGAARSYEYDDLGKFGLGLKTASMSQCRRLTVASRTSKSKARMEVRQLDLDYVERTDAWDVLILRSDERPEAATEPLLSHRGTVILWQVLDRILTYADPSGGWAKKHLLELAQRIEEHLAMVFHRFLAGEVPRKKLRITLNGNAVEPWDPFARAENATQALKTTEYELNTPAGSGIVRMDPYILPPKASFSSEAAWRRQSGPANWNYQQGLYIYRANRLIQSGGWSRIRTIDEHTKLSRIALFFNPELDAAFGINVAKMRVKLPSELKVQIEDAVSVAARQARDTYDAKPDTPKKAGNRQQGKAASPGGSWAAPGDAKVPLRGSSEPLVEAGRVQREAIENAAAVAEESAALKRIVGALRRETPRVARQLGW